MNIFLALVAMALIIMFIKSEVDSSDSKIEPKEESKCYKAALFRGDADFMAEIPKVTMLKEAKNENK